MEFENILYTKADHIATITLNRPETLNSVSGALSQDVLAALDDLEADEDIRVFILTGAGRGFCSGANVGNMAPDAPRDGPRVPVAGSEMVRRIDALKIPSIAMVNGVAAGEERLSLSRATCASACLPAGSSMPFSASGWAPGGAARSSTLERWVYRRPWRSCSRATPSNLTRHTAWGP